MATKRFLYVSEAKKFQAQKRKAGYKTKLIRYQGIAHPHCLVEYIKQK